MEGLGGDGGELSELQAAFRRHHALQCGFCTAGILNAATAWLERVAQGEVQPTEAAVRDMLSGHLCRCTGYTPIVAAVLETALTRVPTDVVAPPSSDHNHNQETTMKRRALMQAALAAVTFAGATASHAQAYPARPVTVVVPFATGSASDVFTRVVLDHMASRGTFRFVVENKPGPAATSAPAGRQGHARRLHAGDELVWAAGRQSRAGEEPRLRPGEGLRSDRAVRGGAQRDRRQHQAAGEDAA